MLYSFIKDSGIIETGLSDHYLVYAVNLRNANSFQNQSLFWRYFSRTCICVQEKSWNWYCSPQSHRTVEERTWSTQYYQNCIYGPVKGFWCLATWFDYGKIKVLRRRRQNHPTDSWLSHKSTSAGQIRQSSFKLERNLSGSPSRQRDWAIDI